ncbi:MAG TPA: response regulator transcription factor, partial [Vicinamibacterales bacterium]|nr:response regulator transcription factor [Vicinamibacterales bacterium]
GSDHSARPIDVAVIEDLPRVREGLRFLIDQSPGYRCAATYRSMEEAIAGIGYTPPSIVLTDIGLPGMSGIEGIRQLKMRFPDLRMVALTVYEDDDRIFDALCAGASGYLLKRTTPARLVECLGEVMNGGAPMSPEVAERVIRIFKDIRPPAKEDYGLTPHEVRILALLAEGHSYKTAAAQLGSSINTIAFHMKSIYLKLQVHSKSEAVAKALRQRIVR